MAGPPASFEIEPRGPFSLSSAARFLAGWPPARDVAEPDATTVRLCFALDSLEGHGAAVVSESGSGRLRVETIGDADADELRSQIERILSLDHDATDLSEVLARDPVAARIHRDADALRPVLFHSPYEAAGWSVISARLQSAAAQRVRRALSEELGCVLDVGGVEMAAFPLPERLVGLDSFPGLPAEKVRRLRGVAEAALEGRLDPERLRQADPAEALGSLMEMRGIGPFYAGLILVRSTGVTDVLPPGVEPRLRAAVGAAYDLDGPASDADYERITAAWRPYRTWVAVLMRSAAAGP